MSARAKAALSALFMTAAFAAWVATLAPPIFPPPGTSELHLGPLRVNPMAAYTLPWALGLYLGGLAGVWVLHRRDTLTPRAVGALSCGAIGFLVGIKLEFRLETMPVAEALRMPLGALAEPGARAPLGLLLAMLVGVSLAALLRAGWREVGDAGAVALSVTIPIGRIACMLAGCCFGKVCGRWAMPLCVTYAPGTPPFAHQLASGQLDPASPASLPLHPLPLYFAAASLVTLAILVWQLWRGVEPGMLLATFAILRPAAKLALEPLRAEGRPGPLMAVIPATVLTGALLVLAVRALRRTYGPALAARRTATVALLALVLASSVVRAADAPPARQMVFERTAAGTRVLGDGDPGGLVTGVRASGGQRSVVVPHPRGDPTQAIVELNVPPRAMQARARSTGAADAFARVRAAITRLAGAGAGAGPRARGVSSPIRHEYHLVLSGFAVHLPVDALDALRGNPDVRAVSPDVVVRAMLASSVPATRAPLVWSTFGYRGAGQIIAIIDSGIDYRHPDLGGCFGPGCKVQGGWDFVDDDADPMDGTGHGTHVASIAAGDGAAPGMAPDAHLLAYRVVGADGAGSGSDVIAALEAAVDPNGDGDTADHVPVVNVSLASSGYPDDPVSRAVDAATAAGAVVVVSAGNDGPDYYTIGSPAGARTAVTVGASDDAGHVASFSSRGPEPDTLAIKPEMTAPGVDICAAEASLVHFGFPCDDTHVSLSGTSQAAPHVAGAAALLRGLRPELPPSEIKSLLVQQARPTGAGALAEGAGTLDVAAAAFADTVVEPTTLGLGLVDPTQATWTVGHDLRVRNVGTTGRSYTLGVSGLPAGATFACTPAAFTLAAGAQTTASCTLTVGSDVPPLADVPYVYEGVLTVSGGVSPLRVPLTFHKTAGLLVHAQGGDFSIDVHNRRDFSTSEDHLDGETVRIDLPPDTYDVIVTFEQFCIEDANCGGELGVCNRTRYVCTGGQRVVVREDVVIADMVRLDVSASEATHQVRFEPRDEQGTALVVPECWFTLQHRASRFGPAFFWRSAAAGIVSLSDVSDRYDLDVAALATTNGKTYFVTEGTSAGIAGDVALGNTPEELTEATVRFHPRPGDPSPPLAWDDVEIALGGGSAVGVSTLRPTPAVEWPLFVSTVPRRPAPIFYGNTVFLPGDPHHATPLLQGDPVPGTISGFIGTETIAPGFRTAHEIPLGLGPPRFFGRVTRTTESLLHIEPAVGSQYDAFLLQGGDVLAVEGGTVPAWTQEGLSLLPDPDPLPQSSDVKGIDTPIAGVFSSQRPSGLPGRITVDAPPYVVGGLAGRGWVELRYDPRRADAEPPALRGLRFESAGRMTDTIEVGAGLQAFVDPVDAAVAGVTLRVGDADHVATRGADGAFAVSVPDPCAGRAGGLPLDLTVTDVAGNSLHAHWEPGLVCMLASCGDGVLDPGERCDDGNRRSGDGCNATCTSDETCGNGLRDAGEQCDDGNRTAGDGCDASCASEAICPMPPGMCFEHAFCAVERVQASLECNRATGKELRGTFRLLGMLGRVRSRVVAADSLGQQCRSESARRKLGRMQRKLARLERAVARSRHVGDACKAQARRALAEVSAVSSATAADLSVCFPTVGCGGR